MKNRRENFKKKPSAMELRYVEALEKQVEMLTELVKRLQDNSKVDGYSYVMGTDLDSTEYHCDCKEISVTKKAIDEDIRNQLEELTQVKCGTCNTTVKKAK